MYRYYQLQQIIHLSALQQLPNLSLLENWIWHIIGFNHDDLTEGFGRKILGCPYRDLRRCLLTKLIGITKVFGKDFIGHNRLEKSLPKTSIARYQGPRKGGNTQVLGKDTTSFFLPKPSVRSSIVIIHVYLPSFWFTAGNR